MPRNKKIPDDDIFEATFNAVSKSGPNDFTLAEVGAAVGISPSTLVQRFGTKRGLLLASFQNAVLKLQSRYTSIEDEISDEPLKDLLRFFDSAVKSIQTKSNLSNQLAMLSIDFADEEFREIAVQHSQLQLGLIQRFLDAAHQSGEIVDIKTNELAKMVHVHFNGCLCTFPFSNARTLSTWVKKNLTLILSPYLA